MTAGSLAIESRKIDRQCKAGVTEGDTTLYIRVTEGDTTLYIKGRVPFSYSPFSYSQTLEPLSEIKALHEKTGASIELSTVVDIAEMGVPAGLVGTVDSISTCPKVQRGPGRVVLTTVNHLNDFVFNLTLKDASGKAETLGVTGYHRFFDETMGWTSTADLHVGETLRGDHGDLTVVAISRDPGVDRVYNMTVESDHVYYVGDLQALTHNVCPTDIERHHLLPQADEFSEFFADAGLDPENYVLKLPAGKHRLRIGNGLHTILGGDWNGVWTTFMNDTPGATGTQVLAQLADMIDQFGLEPFMQ